MASYEAQRSATVVRSRATSSLLVLIALSLLACTGSEDGGGGSAPTMCPAGMIASGMVCVLAGPMQTGGTGGAGGVAGTIAGTGMTGGTTAVTGMTGGMMATGGAAGEPPVTQAGTDAQAMDSGLPPASGSSGCGMATVPADGTQMIDVDGLMREFIVAVPDGYNPNTPHKLVFAWHGLGGTAQQVASGFGRGGYYGLEGQAEGTTIFVAGQGLDTSNSVGSGPGWDNMGGRDIAFTRAMLAWLRSSYCIDDARIFSTGMSYGGIMSNAVGCALGDEFRAIAPMSGMGPSAFGGATCVGEVAAWISHGNTDNVVTFASGQASRDHWVMANHCDSTTDPADANGCVAYQGCDDGMPVVWCEFDGGHTPPSFGSTAIWAFFSQF